MEKKIRTYYVDEDTYIKFKIYSIKKNKSISKLIEEWMKKTIKENK